MENANPSSQSTQNEITSAAKTDGESTTSPTPLRCFTGALGSATLSLLTYRLTLAIATTFANKPVISDNPTVVNVSAAVRTLVMGIVALGAGVFGVAALGLGALGIQLLVRRIGERRAQ